MLLKGNWHSLSSYPPEDPRSTGSCIQQRFHWNDLPYAIYPNPEEACFSGATFVEEDRVIAMYHGTKAGNMVAVSDDDLLLNWKKINNNHPVIKIENDDSSPCYTEFLIHVFGEKENIITIVRRHYSLIILQEEEQELIFIQI